jgi:hypothetical protein
MHGMATKTYFVLLCDLRVLCVQTVLLVGSATSG